MLAAAMSRAPWSDDPLRLREVLARTATLASDHRVPSVIVGFSSGEGDRLFPDFVAFVESELRVEDSVFRLTRDRALLFLADVDPEQARSVVERLVAGFRREFPTAPRTPSEDIGFPGIRIRYFDVPRGTLDLTVKQVLPAIFAPATPLED
jgi:hypothetical protein